MAHYTHEAFTLLVREHQNSLRGFICSLGVAFDWVDDIAQETFILAFQKQDEFDPAGNFGAWIRTIAKNLVLNESSKRIRRRRLLDAHVTDILGNYIEPASPLETFHFSEHTSRRSFALTHCISHLNERARNIIYARYQENLDSGQISKKSGISRSAVRKVLFHARNALARCIQRQLSEPVQ